MPVLKCKMCGAQLEYKPGSRITSCSFCGSLQTLPDTDNDEKLALYDRANNLRLRNDFDKAILAYQSIVAVFPKEAEAHWGLCLSKYGIEYVTDPRTREKIPTCHRTLYDSILDDTDYLDAIKYSDPIAKAHYIEQAREIDRIQKRIIRISQKEEPYDIFICYKETDDGGQRTIDSVLAQDIYDRLTEKGYKVFFARITLEKKIGQDYEPIIFAALRSAKVMLVVGTKTNYFEAVWVKNEWSRFLSLMENDNNKYLFPCYKDIDPYDLPREFSFLQSQDLGKIGYFQDLLRGIDKIFGRDTLKVNSSIPARKKDLMGYYNRVENAITNGDFQKADWLIDTILAENEKDARAYYYKAFLDLKTQNLNYFIEGTTDPTSLENFNLAYKYASDEFKEELDSIIKKVEENKLYAQYLMAVTYKENGDYDNAIEIFKSLNDYQDSEQQIKECKECILLEKYNRGIAGKEQKDYLSAIQIFEELGEFRDSKEQLNECKDLYNFAEKQKARDDIISNIRLNEKEKRSLIANNKEIIKAIDRRIEAVLRARRYKILTIVFLLLGIISLGLGATLLLIYNQQFYNYYYLSEISYEAKTIFEAIVVTSVIEYLSLAVVVVALFLVIFNKEGKIPCIISLVLNSISFIIGLISSLSLPYTHVKEPIIIIAVCLGLLNIISIILGLIFCRKFSDQYYISYSFAYLRSLKQKLEESNKAISILEEENKKLKQTYYELTGNEITLNDLVVEKPILKSQTNPSTRTTRNYIRKTRNPGDISLGIVGNCICASSSLLTIFSSIVVFTQRMNILFIIVGFVVSIVSIVMYLVCVKVISKSRSYYSEPAINLANPKISFGISIGNVIILVVCTIIVFNANYTALLLIIPVNFTMALILHVGGTIVNIIRLYKYKDLY